MEGYRLKSFEGKTHGAESESRGLQMWSLQSSLSGIMDTTNSSQQWRMTVCMEKCPVRRLIWPSVPRIFIRAQSCRIWFTGDVTGLSLPLLMVSGHRVTRSPLESISLAYSPRHQVDVYQVVHFGTPGGWNNSRTPFWWGWTHYYSLLLPVCAFRVAYPLF